MELQLGGTLRLLIAIAALAMLAAPAAASG